MKRIVSLFLVLLLYTLLLVPINVDATSINNPVPQAKQAVVCIASGIYFNEQGRLQTYDREGRYSTGTGFGVGNDGQYADTFVTNCHVVSDDRGNVYDFVYICIDGADIRKESTLVKCDILYTDKEVDLAIIQTKSPISGVTTLPLLPAESMETGDTVYTLGFPGIADVVADRNNYTTEDITVTNGVLSRYQTTDGIQCMAHTATVNHGNSGGPLINSQGEVIGINSFIYYDNETPDLRSYAIYIDYAMTVLDQLEIPYTDATKSVPTGSPDEQTTFPTSESITPTTETQDIIVDSPPAPIINYSMVLIVIAIVAIVIVAVIVLNFQKKGKTHIQKKTMPEYLVRVYMGPLQGKSWELEDKLNIGRDPGCDIVFPPNTNGVSRLHCRVQLYNGKVLVTDLNSSHGTYVSQQPNGPARKLDASVPVEISQNSKILIGSDQVVLVLQRKN